MKSQLYTGKPFLSNWVRIIPVVTWFILVTALTIIYIIGWQNKTREIKHSTEIAAEQVAIRLEENVRGHLGIVKVIRSEWNAGNVDTKESFEGKVISILDNFKGFQAINYINAKGIIEWVVPYESNLPALNKDLHDHPMAAETFIHSENTGVDLLTPPIKLFQGGMGFASYFPVIDDGSIIGYINGVFRINHFIEYCLEGSVWDNYYFNIVDENYELYRYFDEEFETDREFCGIYEINVLNRQWIIKLCPKSEYTFVGSSNMNLVIYFLGLLLSVAIAVLIRIVLKRQITLYENLDKIKSSEIQYKLLADNVRDAIFISVNDKIVFFNSQFVKLTGKPGTLLYNASLADVSPELADELDKHPSNLENDDISYGLRFKAEISTRDGSHKTYDINTTSISYSGTPAVFTIISDISDIVEAEKQKNILESQLRQAQRLETIGNLAGGIAHDFNNILTPIIAYTDIALGEIEAEHPVKFTLDQIQNGAERAKDLVNQILAFSKQIEHERKPVDLGIIIKNSLKLLRATIPSTIKFDLQFCDDYGPVLSDYSQMESTVMNMCTNAAHAMRKSGGTLTIKLNQINITFQNMDQYPSKLNARKYIELQFIDTGHGMDKATLDRIFEPFFTTKTVGEGTGLGLSVVHGIITNHRGLIEVDSVKGKGTNFTIYLPVINDQLDESDEPENDDPGGSENILYVDDEEEIIFVADRQLTKLGYNVTSSVSSSQAIELFRTDPDGFDLVITDQTMPEIDGIEFAGKILEIRSDIPIIVTTGYSDKIADSTFRKFGFSACVMKPIIYRELGLTIRKVLDNTDKDILND